MPLLHMPRKARAPREISTIGSFAVMVTASCSVRRQRLTAMLQHFRSACSFAKEPPDHCSSHHAGKWCVRIQHVMDGLRTICMSGPSRMLKKTASIVLASLRGSTYRSVRLASSLAAALLNGLFEHPILLERQFHMNAFSRCVVYKPSFHADC